MVMEAATPSPQRVGREFVRQYYTLLNQAPTHLHRFYNNNSSFVHGGLGTPDREIVPAVGQKQIHQKIQQLNFRDCHAKISQVDSQETLGEGVVVQVTGELSNGGQPMRRFTQTFVLAAQAPKTYYVHNDIFRYQDLGFPDEEEGGESEGGDCGLADGAERETDEGRNSEAEEEESQVQQRATNATSVDQQQSHASLIPAQQQQPLQQQQQTLYYAPPPQQPVHNVMQPVINGSVHEENSLINQQQTSQQHQYIIEPSAPIEEPFAEKEKIDTPTEQRTEEESQNRNEESQEQTETEDFNTSPTDLETERTSATAVTTNNDKPKTFANLFRPESNSIPSTNYQSSKLSVSPPPITNLRTEDRSIAHPANSGSGLSSSNVSPNQQQTPRIRSNQAPHQQQQQQQQRQQRGGPPPRESDRRGSRPGPYSDAHQLFLGNLPHQATDEELRAMFSRYGKIVDLRIHSKPTGGGKGPQGQNNATRVPNYGFITFEDIQVANKVLQAGSFFYPDEHGQKLNVEEKKMKPRVPMESSGGRPNMNDGNIRPGGGQQQQQQQQQQRAGSGGPGGVMRGGQHGMRGGRGGFPRGGDGGRGGGGMRHPGNPNYQNRSR